MVKQRDRLEQVVKRACRDGIGGASITMFQHDVINLLRHERARLRRRVKGLERYEGVGG